MSNLNEDDYKKIAQYVIDEMLERFRLNVGKTLLDTVWKWFVGIIIVFAIYIIANNHKLQ